MVMIADAAKKVEAATKALNAARKEREVAEQRPLPYETAYAVAEGRAEGQAIGRAEALREVILRLGEERFGPPDTRVTGALSRVSDPRRLDELTRRLLHAASWQELLGQPRRRSRG